MDKLYADVRRSMALEETIKSEIRARGPMTFARFMELALYHPELGYYRATQAPMTRAGDFVTAPETHPVFGALLARFARVAADAIEASEFTVVEQGPGTGALALSFLQYWRAAWPSLPVRYVAVEPDPGARERLAARLGDRAILAASLEDVAPFSGLFLSNELPDAFPVHRLRLREGAIVEVFVTLDGGLLAEAEGPPSTDLLARELAITGSPLAEGQEIEVNMGLRPWMEAVAATLTRGYALTIDYGYAADEASRFPRGTLLAHYRHSVNEDFFARIGRQDLTAHVCWTALERHGADAGLTFLERTTQREFLTRWGWKDYGRWLYAQPGATHPVLDAVDRLGRTEDGLGGLGVLLQAKGELSAPRPEHAGPLRWDAVPALQSVLGPPANPAGSYGP